jgi:hypothetical protein
LAVHGERSFAAPTGNAQVQGEARRGIDINVDRDGPIPRIPARLRQADRFAADLQLFAG